VPTFRAIDAGGRRVDDPSAEQIHDLLADLSLNVPFLILERLDREPIDQHYMQTHLCDDLSYQVEFRDGSEDRHFQAYVPRQPDLVGVQPVADLFSAWMADRPGWRDTLDWQPLAL